MAAVSGTTTGTSLFVGNLDNRVYRELLTEVFSLAGEVVQCHIVFDKNTGESSGFGFVEFKDNGDAQSAMEKFRGRSIYGKLMTIDWARTSIRDASGKIEDLSNQYCLFVGNLSPDVTDEQLMKAFSQFGSCTGAKCVKDPTTYKKQGFAFVSFRERADASAAMEAMDGQILNNRALRVDWAKGKANAATRAAAMGLPDPIPSNGNRGRDVTRGKGDNTEKPHMPYETVSMQTSPHNVTVYVSGLSTNTTESDLMEIFSQHGIIREIRIPDSIKTQKVESIYAFIRYERHDFAAKTIFNFQKGVEVNGKNAQVHWGRENPRRQHGHPGRGPPQHMQQYGSYQSGFNNYAPYNSQQGYNTYYGQHEYGGRPPYSNQMYNNRNNQDAGPGPTYQPSHVGQQHRFRPY